MSKTILKKIVIFESPKVFDQLLISWYCFWGIPVWVVEPFHAYHHSRGGIWFYPSALPAYIYKWEKKGKIHFIKAQQFNAEDIYCLAADRAVEVLELVFPFHKKEYSRFFQYVCDTLKSSDADGVFKINLGNRLAEFYSMNMMLDGISKLFAKDTILFYLEKEIGFYECLRDLLGQAHQNILAHSNISFPFFVRFFSWFKRIKENVKTLIFLLARVILSAVLFWQKSRPLENKRSYLYGINVVSALRQLGENQRIVNFLIDERNIFAKDVIYFPLIKMSDKHKERLAQLSSDVGYSSRMESYHGYFSQWINLFSLSLRCGFLRNAQVVKSACLVFDRYFKWQRILEKIQLKHFVTHCDFGGPHIGRNIALRQAGVETWYFSDSMNHTCNLREDMTSRQGRHPLWTYLNYDHLVIWDDFLGQYLHQEHPGSFKEVHVVGCLWASHIQSREKMNREFISSISPDLENRFVISVFDSTYSCNSFTSYQEGIAFAEHILKLVEMLPDVYILLKEKNKRSFHLFLDPIKGKELLELYEKMARHPRVSIASSELDSARLISVADVTVSFPFTSTTFEALSANRAALWHDPLGYYKKMIYAKNGGVMTHNFEELKEKILQIKSSPLPTVSFAWKGNPALMDPYRDGKAIERFRQLLKGDSSYISHEFRSLSFPNACRQGRHSGIQTKP